MEKDIPMKLKSKILAVAFSFFATMLIFSSKTNAYTGEHVDKNKVVGGYLSSGFAFVAGEGYEDLWNSIIINRNDRTAKFATGGGAYFDYYFTSMFGIEAGLEFLTKGIRFSDDDIRLKESLVYMGIPVCFKIDYRHFQAAVGLELFVALSGQTTVKDTDLDSVTKTKWNDRDRWQYVHRVNFGPKIVLGYAVPVGPIYIVPSMSWSIHLINDLNNDEIHRDNPLIPDDEKLNMRANNLMFNVGVEWGF